MKPTPLKAYADFLGIAISSETILTGLCIDSRKAQNGDLFFALPGARVDGHDYLAMAAQKGAIAALVREDYKGPNFGLDLLFVPDVLLALQQLARAVLQKRECKVVGVTGSIGKTTTKEFAAALLGSTYKIFKTPHSYNTKTTLPLCILLAEGDEEVYVLEMGMTDPGDIARLISIAPPDVAALTTVALQHANNFPEGVLSIAKEKGAIFSHPKTKIGILNKEIEHFEMVSKIGSCQKVSFSLTDCNADYYLEGECVVYENGTPHPINLKLPLKPHYQNFLTSVAIARVLGVSWEAIAKESEKLKLPPMRFEKIEKGGIVFINDAYNANPDSLKAALEHLPSPAKGGKTIAVLSEMNALGQYSQEGHSLVAKVALKHADILLCLGSHAKTYVQVWQNGGKQVNLCQTKEELATLLKKTVQKGDVVLLKGARAYALEELLTHF